MAKKNKSLGVEKQARGGDTRPIKTIRNEQDAVNLLSELREITGPLPFQLKFDGWPILSANVKGEQFNSTMTTGVMHGFLALQKELNRSYTIVKFGEQRQPNLSNSEKESLELAIKVDKGSSDFITVNTPSIFDAIATTLTNMNSAHTATVLIVAALAYFGSGTIKTWLSTRKEIRLKEIEKDEDSAAHDTAINMSREETARMQVIREIVSDCAQLRQVVHNANVAHDELLKSFNTADSVTIQGVNLSGDFVREVTATQRRDFHLKTYNKPCRILKVDTSTEAKYKVTIKILDTSQEITCPLEDETMDARYKEKILAALSNRTKVILSIEARAHGDMLKDVKILGIKE